jgi:hypothetical protein
VAASTRFRAAFAGPIRSRTVSRASMVVLLVAIAVAPMLWDAISLPAAAIPPVNWSFYVNTSSSSRYQTLGCNQAHFDDTENSNSSVFLDFGAQRSDGSGALSPFGQNLSNAQIQSLSAYFLIGYQSCLSEFHVLRFYIGTNNDGSVENATLGADWAGVVNEVAYFVSTYLGPEVVGGGNDFESWCGSSCPSAATGANANNWISGFEGATSALYLDFGSADGCSETAHTNIACNNGWSTAWYSYVSWRATAALGNPQIYYGSQADQWTQIALYNWYSRGASQRFEAPLDEYDLDSSTYTTSDAYGVFSYLLDLDSHTAQTMTYSMEVHHAV